jgi:hypothetical protein
VIGSIVTFLLMLALRNDDSPTSAGRAPLNQLDIPQSAVVTPAPAEARPRVEDFGSEPVIGNIKTNIFHRPNCPAVRRMSEENRKKFHDGSQARAEGYNPCRECILTHGRTGKRS